MANSNNWGEIYKSTWWGDEDWSANSLKIDSAPPGFAGQNLLLGSEELDQSDDGEWERININAVDANVAGVANPLSSDETVEKVDFQASPTSRIIQDVTLVAGTQYTFSVWAKSAGASNEQFRLRYWDRTAASGGGDLFTALTTDWSPTSGRYSFTFTAASSGVHAMHIQNSGSVQRRIYFWGAMLNEGATAGDYIKTEFTPQPSNPPTAPMEFGDNFVGVTAYYSLRRFTTGEDNNAIRVRRSSDDTEQDIGFDSNGDLDTTALTTFVNAEHTLADEDFSSAIGWNLGTGLTITGGVLRANTSGGGITAYKNFGDPGAQQVRVTFTISNYVSGSVRYMNFGTPTLGTSRSSNGTYTETLTLNAGGNFNHGLQFNSSFVGDIDDFEIVQITADGAVTTFYDQSGNGNNATNSTASEQPLVVSGGTLATENGKAAIKPIDRSATLQMSALTLTANTSVFSVLKNNSLNSTTSLIEGDNANEFLFIGSPTSTSTLIDSDYTSVSRFKNGLSFSPSTRQDVYNGVVNQTLITHFFDGSVSTSVNLGYPSSAFIGMYLIQEIIIFDSDQSSNRTGIETNINDHFSIYP